MLSSAGWLGAVVPPPAPPVLWEGGPPGQSPPSLWAAALGGLVATVLPEAPGTGHLRALVKVTVTQWARGQRVLARLPGSMPHSLRYAKVPCLPDPRVPAHGMAQWCWCQRSRASVSPERAVAVAGLCTVGLAPRCWLLARRQCCPAREIPSRWHGAKSCSSGCGEPACRCSGDWGRSMLQMGKLSHEEVALSSEGLAEAHQSRGHLVPVRVPVLLGGGVCEVLWGSRGGSPWGCVVQKHRPAKHGVAPLPPRVSRAPSPRAGR